MILSRRLRVAPILLTFLLTAPLAAARAEERRPQEVRQPRPGITGLLSEVWALLGRIWEKEGSSTDPFGNPKPSSVQPPSESDSAQLPASGT